MSVDPHRVTTQVDSPRVTARLDAHGCDEVDLREHRGGAPDRIASTLSRRLETLWVEANRQVDRDDLEPDAAQGWVEALDHLTLALQALEDVGSPPSRTWGHRAWYDRRPG